MTWWHRSPGHQQPWYWPSFCSTFCTQHQNGSIQFVKDTYILISQTCMINFNMTNGTLTANHVTYTYGVILCIFHKARWPHLNSYREDCQQICLINTMRCEQNGTHFAGYIFKCILCNVNFVYNFNWILHITCQHLFGWWLGQGFR